MNKLGLNLVANELALVEERMLEPDSDRHETVDHAITHLIKSGGKRIRPTVTLLISKALDADCLRAVNMAAAVEMLHTATLVHDDIIDGALFRRGIPTLNATWSPGATILAGDYMFARAAEMASRTGNVEVMSLFAKTLMTICNGELHQMFNAGKPAYDRPSYYRRIFAKTGALFVLAAETPAVLAEADPAIRDSLRVYGRELGIAFQIIDDLLDFVGSETQVGKPLGGDLAQGLVTLPAICLLESSPGDRRILDVIDGRRQPKDIQRALEAVRASDAVGRTHDEARVHARLAKEALADLSDNSYRQTLLNLADYTVERTL